MISETLKNTEDDPSVDIAMSIQKISETANTGDDYSEDVAKSIQKFMLSMYPIMAKDRQLLFSPFSIYFQLVLLYLGAVDDTALEMMEYLYLPHCRERLLKGMRTVLRKLRQSSVKIMMEMFIHHSYKLRAKFRSDAMRFLNCNLRNVDFAAPEETRKVINNWASSRSSNKINNLIPSGAIDQFFEFVILGAFCIEDSWLNQFEEEHTIREKFFESEDRFAEVDMMHISGQFHYVRKESYRVLALPCKDEKLKMMIVLPNEIDGLTECEQKISELDVMNIFQDAKMEEVNVIMPRFKWIKFNQKIHAQLRRLGLKIIFDPKKANFTEIHKLGQELICVDFIKHKVIIEVNEKGIDVVVKVDGLNNRPVGISSGRKREADSKLPDEETEKVAKMSEESPITIPQSSEKEVSARDEARRDKTATVSGLKAEKSKCKKETVDYSNFSRMKLEYETSKIHNMLGTHENLVELLDKERELDFNVFNEKTKKVAKISEESVITNPQSEQKEAATSEEVHRSEIATVSELKTNKLEEETVKVSNCSPDATINYSDTDQKEMVDYSCQEIEESTFKKEEVCVGNENFSKKVSEADSRVIDKETEKVAKISEESVQSRQKEAHQNKIATVSELKAEELEKERVTVSNLGFDEEKNYSHMDQEELEDEESMPETEDDPEKNVKLSKELLEKTAQYEASRRKEDKTIPEMIAEAVLEAEIEELVSQLGFKNLDEMPEGDCVGTESEDDCWVPESETHGQDREISSSPELSDGQLKDVEEEIPTAEKVEVVIEETKRIPESVIEEKTEVPEKAKAAVPESSVRDIEESAESSIQQIKTQEQNSEDTSTVPQSHNKETIEVLQRDTDEVQTVPKSVEKENETTFEDNWNKMETTSAPEIMFCPDELVKNFTANHPFIFCILYDCTSLLIGKYNSAD